MSQTAEPVPTRDYSHPTLVAQVEALLGGGPLTDDAGRVYMMLRALFGVTDDELIETLNEMQHDGRIIKIAWGFNCSEIRLPGQPTGYGGSKAIELRRQRAWCEDDEVSEQDLAAWLAQRDVAVPVTVVPKSAGTAGQAKPRQSKSADITPARQEVLDALEGGPIIDLDGRATGILADRLGVSSQATHQRIKGMVQAGLMPPPGVVAKATYEIRRFDQPSQFQELLAERARQRAAEVVPNWVPTDSAVARPVAAIVTQCETPRRSIMTSATEIELKELEMIWGDRLMVGVINVIAGLPGMGKSTLSMAIAAALSREGMKVVVSNKQDDPSSVTRPRLEAANAHLANIQVVIPDLVPVLPRELDVLAEVMAEADCLILDPISAHFHSARMMHNNQLLTRLGAMARDLRCTIVGIHHTIKIQAGMSAIDAIGGPPSGLSGEARTVYLYGNDPADEDRRALACVKINGVDTPPTQIIEQETVEIRSNGQIYPASRLIFVGESGAQAKGLLHRGKQKSDRDAACAEWLTTYLSQAPHGLRRVGDIMADGVGAGFAQESIKRVRFRLKVEQVIKRGGGSTWQLPLGHPMRQPAGQV